MKEGIVLFAHGSRDPQWRAPVERLRRTLARRQRGAAVVVTAYLERTRPDLATQVARLAERGLRRLTIVPVFLGAGRHLKRDLTRQAAVLRRRHHDLQITVRPPIGDDRRVTNAIAAAIARPLK